MPQIYQKIQFYHTYIPLRDRWKTFNGNALLYVAVYTTKKSGILLSVCVFPAFPLPVLIVLLSLQSALQPKSQVSMPVSTMVQCKQEFSMSSRLYTTSRVRCMRNNSLKKRALTRCAFVHINSFTHTHTEQNSKYPAGCNPRIGVLKQWAYITCKL